jgi:hypothetical protein
LEKPPAVSVFSFRGLVMNTSFSRIGASALVLSAVIISGCSRDPIVSPTPTPTPTPAPSPSPPPEPLPSTPNTVYLTTPAAPARSATNPLPGRYQLEIVADARTSGLQCDAVPDYATRRTYAADIHEVGGHFAVKLYDARFLADGQLMSYGCQDSRLPQSGLAVCHQFLLSGDADALNLSLEPLDEWRGSQIVESLPDGFLLSIRGNASGRLADGRIEARGKGTLWYGNGLPATQYYGCDVGEMKFTFTAR